MDSKDIKKQLEQNRKTEIRILLFIGILIYSGITYVHGKVFSSDDDDHTYRGSYTGTLLDSVFHEPFIHLGRDIGPVAFDKLDGIISVITGFIQFSGIIFIGKNTGKLIIEPVFHPPDI